MLDPSFTNVYILIAIVYDPIHTRKNKNELLNKSSQKDDLSRN